ncbi:hypothetical protein P2H44_04225 [Albimonas sp. CAU 1670]|uniref:hypothetical protein n=1 Tax=Albimonas sp. CAU 1670 TaxID=3032599 RepID=UPI0023DB3947|nr:hypothetical protein [Albimonas sp. CAU 1670]MDF2231750.1 hypothetical protein [Albimonas sp. CAU 1670]
MSEELRPGFYIKTAVQRALDSGGDIDDAVQVTISQLGIGRSRSAPSDDGGDSPPDDFGYDVRGDDDGLF